MERSGARQYDKHPELSLAEGAAFICALSNLCQYSEARMVDLLSILYGACQAAHSHCHSSASVGSSIGSISLSSLSSLPLSF